MCCFSRRVEHVSGTRIFARGTAQGRQLLAYSMSVAISEDLAMVLPLPVPPQPGEDAVRFIDLSAHAGFFTELDRYFPEPSRRGAPGLASRHVQPQQRQLKVHDVGDFEASFVPSRADFSRLDPRFQLPGEALGPYDGWGFCVFKLKPGKRAWFTRKLKAQTIHPMAFEFPRRDASRLFFPTLHVHDGEVHATAEFDHALYCQVPAALAPFMRWQRSEWPLSMEAPLVEKGALAFREKLSGEYPNRDTVVDEAAIAASGVITERFLVHSTDGAPVGERAARVAKALEQHGWTKRAYDPALPTRYPPFEHQSIELAGGVRTLPAPAGEPCRVNFLMPSWRVELAFDTCPSKATFEEIQRALC